MILPDLKVDLRRGAGDGWYVMNPHTLTYFCEPFAVKADAENALDLMRLAAATRATTSTDSTHDASGGEAGAITTSPAHSPQSPEGGVVADRFCVEMRDGDPRLGGFVVDRMGVIEKQHFAHASAAVGAATMLNELAANPAPSQSGGERLREASKNLIAAVDDYSGDHINGVEPSVAYEEGDHDRLFAARDELAAALEGEPDGGGDDRKTESFDHGRSDDRPDVPVAQDGAESSRGGDKRFTTGTLSGDLRELAKLIRDQTEQDWIGVTESNSVNETLESAQAWRHNCRAYAEGVEQAAGYIEDDGLAEAGRSVIADRLAEQLANGVPPEEIEWPEAWANLAREIKKYGGGSRD